MPRILSSPSQIPPAPELSHDDWVRDRVRRSLEDPRPSIPHEKVMRQMRALLARLDDGGKPENRHDDTGR